MRDGVTEQQAADATIAYLNDAHRRDAPLKDLFFYLPKYLQLSASDREVMRSRPGDLKWHAAVRNIGAHAGQPGNAITEGRLVKRRGGGYALPRRP